MKQQIVRQFLEEGILLSPEALSKITEKNLEKTLEQAREEGKLVFSLKEEQEGFLIEVRKIQKKQKFTAQELARYYNSRFEGMRGLLEKKMDGLVSISNAKKSLAPVSTIGMVREATQRGFIIEDTTGEAEIITKSEEPQPDDVIGVKGHVKEGKIFTEEIAWPDVPMNRHNNRPQIQLVLSEKDSHKSEYVITPEAVSGPDRKKSTLPNPGWITITREGVQATVLVYNPNRSVSQKEAFGWLKRRHLLPDKTQIRSTEDPFLIEPIPDLVWIIGPEQWSESYKGVIIVCSDGTRSAEVNLEKGEVAFRD